MRFVAHLAEGNREGRVDEAFSFSVFGLLALGEAFAFLYLLCSKPKVWHRRVSSGRNKTAQLPERQLLESGGKLISSSINLYNVRNVPVTTA